MTQNRDELDFRREGDATVVDVRREGDNSPGLVGYLPGNASAPKGWPGDQRFPYVKDVPDLEIPKRYLGPVYSVNLPDPVGPVVRPAPNLPFAEDSPVPDLDAFLVLPAIAVTDIRLCTFFVEYFPNGGILSIIPEVRIVLPETTQRKVNEAWFPLGVVDPSLGTSGSAPEPGPFLAGGAYRLTYASEFRIEGVNNSVLTPIRETLIFDVTPYTFIRLRVADVFAPSGSGLNLLYVRGR